MQNRISNNFYINNEFYSSLPGLLSPNERTIKILMIGDVVGKGGRKILKKVLTPIKRSTTIDFTTVNGENLAGGFGITEKIYHELKSIGIDAITMGNHWKDKPDIHKMREKYKDIILPKNITGISDIDMNPSFYLEDRKKTLSIINLMGNFAMKEEYKNPFDFLLKEQAQYKAKVTSKSHIIIADIHAEASSEKQAIAFLYDGILAALIGTHTHTPTSDERITNLGTAFLTDVGMTGAYDSVIGMKKERVIKRLSDPANKVAFEVAENDLWFCAFLVEVSLETHLASACHRLQCRGFAEEYWSVFSVFKSEKQII